MVGMVEEGAIEVEEEEEEDLGAAILGVVALVLKGTSYRYLVCRQLDLGKMSRLAYLRTVKYRFSFCVGSLSSGW